MNLFVIDVIGQQGPDVFSLGTGVRRGHRQLTISRREQGLDRRHRLLEELTNCTAHGCRHVCLRLADQFTPLVPARPAPQSSIPPIAVFLSTRPKGVGSLGRVPRWGAFERSASM